MATYGSERSYPNRDIRFNVRVNESSVCLDERHGHYSLTLNRPHVLNAFHEEMLHEFVGALETITDPGQPLIVTGAGRAFCTGGDLKTYLRRLDDKEGLLRYFLSARRCTRTNS